MASNVVDLARQSWMNLCDQQVANISFIDPACAADREAAFTAAMMACAAIIYLNTSSYASSIFICRIDATNVPSSVFSQVRDASQWIFTLLRDSVSLPLPPVTHAPFFCCSQLIAVHGSLLTIDREGESRAWNRAIVASNLELGEWELRRQALKWPCAQPAVDEIQRLRFGLGTEVGGQNVRLMLEIN
jgi:hypothetical protein